MKKIIRHLFFAILIIASVFFLFTNSFSQGSWTTQSSGTTKTLYSIFFLNSNIGFTAGDSGVILKTTNSGINWIQQTSNSPTTIECMQFLNSQRGYATGGNKFLSTTDGGVNWQVISFYITNRIHSLFFINDSTGFLAGAGNFFRKTSNYGINWTEIPGYATIDSNDCLYFIDSYTGFVTCDYYHPMPPYIINAAVSRTTNSGNNWTWYNADINQRMGKVHFGSSTNGMCVGIYGGVAKTSNTGIQWTQIAPSSSYRAVFMTSSTNIYLVGNSGSINKSTNFGTTWLNVSYSSAHFKSVYFVNDTVGFVCGSGGTIIKTTNGGISDVSKTQSNIPNKYSLEQNYPNPFNPSTKISYKVESYKVIKLVVYDILGKEVETMVNEKQSPGTYEVSFDASNLTSGIYFYSLFVDWVRIDTKRMVLIK